MITSRSVDHLTYTYYTGQEGSVPNGPNCHNCMNQLFRENSLVDVQFAYVSTSRGFVALNIRSLVFLNGVETPFTVPGFTEDILVTCCIMCVKKDPGMPITETKSNVEVESITRKRKLAPDCFPNMETESFDKKENAKEAEISSSVLHESKPIMPNIDVNNSHLSSTDTESLNRLPTLNFPVSNPDIITNIQLNDNETSQPLLIDTSGPKDDDGHGNLTTTSKPPLIDISGSDDDDKTGNLTTTSKPPLIEISVSEDGCENRNQKTGTVFNITSLCPAILNANTNDQFVIPNSNRETVPTVAEESHAHIMDFPFPQAKKRRRTPDDMTEQEVLKNMIPLRKMLRSRIFYSDCKCFACEKSIYCEYCDCLVGYGRGVSMVNHFYSNAHMSSIYEKGFVFSSADFNRQFKTCSCLNHTMETKRCGTACIQNVLRIIGKKIRSIEIPQPPPDAEFPFPVQSIGPTQDPMVLDESSKNLHLSILLVDFPFARGRLNDQVNDPMQGFTELEDFSKDLTDASLTDVVKYSFPCKESIHCYYCNVVFEPPHGAMFMRHLISSSHYSKVIGSDRLFSVSGDLNRLKRMCRFHCFKKITVNQSNIEAESITRNRKLAADFSPNMVTESFDEEHNSKETAISSYVLHESKPIVPTIDADSSRLSSTDKKNLNLPAMLNSPVSNHDFTSVNRNNDDIDADSSRLCSTYTECSNPLPMLNFPSSQPTLIDISGSEHVNECETLTTGAVDNIVSCCSTAPNANTNGQFVIPNSKQEAVPAVAGESHTHIMDFPFLRPKTRSETPDAMTKQEVLRKVDFLRKILLSRIHDDCKCFASEKMFYCEYCHCPIRSGGGVDMVDHFYSDRHISSVYEKGFVFSSADFNKQFKTRCCQEHAMKIRSWGIVCVNVEVESITRKRKLVSDCSPYMDTDFFGEEKNSNEAEIPSSDIHKSKQIVPTIDGDSSRPSSNDTESLNQLLMLNSPVSKQDIITSIQLNNDETSKPPLIDISGSDDDDKTRNLTTTSKPPLIDISGSEDGCENRNQKTGTVFNITSLCPAILNANTNDQFVIPNSKKKAVPVPTVAGGSHSLIMNFPFLRAKIRSGTPDAMTKQEVLTNVIPLRRVLQSRILCANCKCFASEKEFYCEYCNKLVGSGNGVDMVDHFYSDRHISSVYEKGFVLSSTDFKRQFKACRCLMRKQAVETRICRVGNKQQNRRRYTPLNFPIPMILNDPGNGHMQNESSKKCHLSILRVDFPFASGKLKGRVIDPMQDFTELEDFSKNITDVSLTSVVKYNFSYKESIHCYYCNVVFEPPHGAMFMRHLISHSHYTKVIGSDRVFSISGDLDRFKRMCKG